MRNMPVQILYEAKKLTFPPLEESKTSGLLAVGGDLSPERIICAYSKGIFPWYGEGAPIMWWCPDPRCVLIPSELKISRSLKRALQNNEFTFSIDNAFSEVINYCAELPRPGQNGTWLQPEMIEAYIELHKLGIAHSVEAWHEGELVGGLYGIVLGKVFFGESMFYLKENASKLAFLFLVEHLKKQEFQVIDCQQTTTHMLRMGAKEISRNDFINIITKHVDISQHAI